MSIRGLSGAMALCMLVTVPEIADARNYESRREHREEKRKNTAIGVGLGMLGGAILSGGDPWATVAGAAAGGAIGNVATGDRDRGRDRRYRYQYRRY